MNWGEFYGRLMVATIRTLMLLLAVLDIVNTMMQHTQAERTLTMLVFPAFLLLGREGITLRDAQRATRHAKRDASKVRRFICSCGGDRRCRADLSPWA